MSRSLSLAPPPSSRQKGAFTLEEGLWFGDFDDDGAREAAQASMAAMAGRVMGARPFPEAAQKLVQLTREDDADFNKVVRVLEMDPGLSQRVLRLVNSAGYGLRLRCTSISHAAALLGQLKLRQIATSAVLFDHFGKPSAMTRKKQEHGSLVASLCRYLAIHLGLPQDDLFTIGLLHDLGQLMMLDDGDPDYAALVAGHDDDFDTLHLAERELLGFDHAVLAGQVLASWSIPSPVPEVISLHHQPAIAHQRGLDIAAMVQTLRFADQMAHLLENGKSRQGPARLAESEAASYLDFSEVQIAAMWRDLEKVHEATKSRRLNILDIAPRSVNVPRSLAPRDRGISMTPSRRGESLAPESLAIPSYSDLVPSFSNYPLASENAAPMPFVPSQKPPVEERGSDEPRFEAKAAPVVFEEKTKIEEKPTDEAFFSSPPKETSGSLTFADPSPEVFPCSICYGPTFGARCPACGAHVCPEHQTSSNWCQACEDEFQDHKRNHPLSGLFRLFGSVSLAVLFLSSWFFSGFVAGLTMLGLGLIAGFGVYVVYQAVLKIRFKQNSHIRAARRARISSTGLPKPLLSRVPAPSPPSESGESAFESDPEAPSPFPENTSSFPGNASKAPPPRSTRLLSSAPEHLSDSREAESGDAVARLEPSRRIPVNSGMIPGVPSIPPEPVIISHRPENRLSAPPGSRSFVPRGMSDEATETPRSSGRAEALLAGTESTENFVANDVRVDPIEKKSEPFSATSIAPPDIDPRNVVPSAAPPRDDVELEKPPSDGFVIDRIEPSLAPLAASSERHTLRATAAPEASRREAAPSHAEPSAHLGRTSPPLDEASEDTTGPTASATDEDSIQSAATPSMTEERAPYAVTAPPTAEAPSEPRLTTQPSEEAKNASLGAPTDVPLADSSASASLASTSHASKGEPEAPRSAPHEIERAPESSVESLPDRLRSLAPPSRDTEVENAPPTAAGPYGLTQPASAQNSESPGDPELDGRDTHADDMSGDESVVAENVPFCEAPIGGATKITPPNFERQQFCQGAVGTVRITGPRERSSRV